MLRDVLGPLVCAGMLLFSAWPSDSAAQTRREIRIGAPGIPTVVDPAGAVGETAALIARQVFDTLVAYRDGSTDVEPALATRWSVSRDGLTWSFLLRDNVRFHDGVPLTAVEVVASFARSRDGGPGAAPPGRAVWTALLRGVPGVLKEVRAADPRTVQFVLVQPYAPLLTVLAHPGLAVARATTTADGSTRLVGTGPYRVVDTASGRIALEAEPAHWRGAPRAGRLVFLDVSTDDQAEAEMDAGTLDVWFPAAPPRRSQGAVSIPGLRVGYLAFQTEREPLARKQVRQAVATAIDPASLGAALDGVAIPLQSFLPPGVWARREGSPILGGGREAARKLLREAGGLGARAERLTLLVHVEEGVLDAARVAESVVSSLGAADLPTHFRLDPTPAGREVVQAGNQDMVLTEAAVVGGDPHLFLFPLSTTEGASKGPRLQNFSLYRNPRVDDLLIRASQLAYRVERQRLYQRAQAMLADDLPWIPLYVRLQWAVTTPDVRGLRLHPTGFHRLDTLSLEAPF
jgi:peptide/nickel transport system substrate-binding protein